MTIVQIIQMVFGDSWLVAMLVFLGIHAFGAGKRARQLTIMLAESNQHSAESARIAAQAAHEAAQAALQLAELLRKRNNV